CLTCHNHFPTLAEGALNKYETMPTGIECERCHGPGEVHVREKLAGQLVDTSQFIDYTIVNPAKLSRERQMDLCQRCHLQGVAVLKAGKTFYDFKPGLPLADYINVFLPRYDNSHEKFIMASQADRLRRSKCYQQSDMTCITCHNPHQSVRQTDARQHNATCLNCHKSETACTAPAAALSEAENNCVHCHMPKSGSKDIPHVRITDHYISKNNTSLSQPIGAAAPATSPRFLGLQLMTKEQGSPLEMAQGYLACYDKYIPAAIMLDSAYFYLNAAQVSLTESYPSWVHYHFNRQDYPAILELIPMLDTSSITDAWTNYRIGEAFLQAGDAKTARQFYRKAVAVMPYHLDFQEKLGTAELYLKRNRAATEVFDFVLSENEKRPLALLNRGYLYALDGDLQNAENYYNRALALEPDYTQALLNKAALYMLQQDIDAARNTLEQVLQIEPDNPEAQSVLNQLKSK
ncbi:MAG: tetratricopeptide repeat protein, partial [Phaeodactylibacter sp.]|nr:tetratricopeptide repeat protein [Phaeodactylibacter sp.]